MRPTAILCMLSGFCASAHADITKYDCGVKKPMNLSLDYSADGKTVTALNSVGRIVIEGDVLGRQSDQGIDYLLLTRKQGTMVALRMTGQSRDEVTFKAGRFFHKCRRI